MSASTEVQSNAFNFGDFLSAGVDPRTGHFMMNINLPSFSSNDLMGPTLALALSYNLLNGQNHGFGKGWSLNLSRYSPDNNRVLSLRSGETFSVTAPSTGDQPAPIEEQKIPSFHLHAADLSNGPYRVVHRSGEVEHLAQFAPLDGRVAVPVQVTGPLGHGLTLQYNLSADSRGVRLENVLDDKGNVLLRLEYHVDRVIARLAPEGNEAQLRLDFLLTNERLTRVEVQGVPNAAWTLRYQAIRGYDCIVEARTPQGTIELLDYADGGHMFPGDVRPALPRVTSHRLYPGAGMPLIETAWAYSSENYLGYGGMESPWQSNGTDQLYEVTRPDFSYSTVERLLAPQTGGQPASTSLREIRRTYNRFHQMVEQRTERNGHVLTEAIAYYTDDNKQFRDQPAYFQLPRVRQVRWEKPGGARGEKTEHRYDTHGNLVWQQGADGTVEEYEYYPPEGDGDACPPEPNGFSNLLKCKRVVPSEGRPGEAPVRQTVYRYVRLPALSGIDTPGLNVLAEACLQWVNGEHVEELSRETTEYHNVPSDRLLHGRVARQRSQVNGYTAVTEFTYSASGEGLRDRAITTQTISLGHDRQGKGHRRADAIISERTVNCLTGTERATRDNEGVVQRAEYDALGRPVIETIEGPGAASRTYRYAFAGVDGNSEGNQTIAVDVNGVEVTTVADGLGRPVSVFRSLVAGEQGAPISRFAYDELGHCTEQVEFDDYPGAPSELITRRSFDDWGNLSRVSGPDGVVTVTQTSLTPLAPAASSLLRWQEHPALPGERLSETFTQYNTFGKPDYEERRLNEGATQRSADRMEYLYDGLGRCIRQTETLPMKPGRGLNAHTRTTAFTYDAWDRVCTTTRPDKSELRTTFAPFSSQALATKLTLDGNGQQFDVGEQTFDHLGRLIKRGHGTLHETLEYKPGSLLVNARTLANGQRLAYQYEPSLTTTPTHVSGGGQTQLFEYDARTGLVTGGEANQASTSFIYNRLGEVEQSILKDQQYPDHVTTFTHSLQGRRLSRAATDTAPAAHEYDSAGRLARTTQGLVDTVHAYNALGLLAETTTTAPDGECRTRRYYDSLGREVERRVNLTGMAEWVIRQTWSDDDLLLRRQFESDGQPCLDEAFEYDLLGRLNYCAYQGDDGWLPTDRFGQRIASETVEFDALGNLERVITTFTGAGAQVQAVHEYDQRNRSQLIAINYLPDGTRYPAKESFAHDTQGCLTQAGEGHTFVYDLRGRMIEAATQGGAVRTYRYDPHDELLGVTDAGLGETRYFYDGLSVSHTTSPTGGVQYQYDGDGHAVAERDPSEEPRLLATDANGSIRASRQGGAVAMTGYDAWGNRNGPLASTLGYNGERHDSLLDGYLLGQGYRAYLPRLRRFNAPDSASPFDGGGLNPYAYAGGNPVTFHDPTGHFISKVAGPERTPEPQPVPEPSWWQKWMPVAIGVVTTVVFTMVFPPASAAAWGLVLGTAAASTTWNSLVAADVVEDNAIVNITLVVLDMGAEPLAARVAGGAARAASKASSRSSRSSSIFPLSDNWRMYPKRIHQKTLNIHRYLPEALPSTISRRGSTVSSENIQSLPESVRNSVASEVSVPGSPPTSNQPVLAHTVAHRSTPTVELAPRTVPSFAAQKALPKGPQRLANSRRLVTSTSHLNRDGIPAVRGTAMDLANAVIY